MGTNENEVIKALNEIQQYRSIGTPDECRAAVEKQREKPVIHNVEDGREYEDFICPRCKTILQQRRKRQKMSTVYQCKRCNDCGQVVSWRNIND